MIIFYEQTQEGINEQQTTC